MDRYALVDLADWLKTEGRCLDVTEIMHLAFDEAAGGGRWGVFAFELFYDFGKIMTHFEIIHDIDFKAARAVARAVPRQAPQVFHRGGGG